MWFLTIYLYVMFWDLLRWKQKKRQKAINNIKYSHLSSFLLLNIVCRKQRFWIWVLLSYRVSELGKYAVSRVRVRVPTSRVRVRVRVLNPQVRVRVRVPPKSYSSTSTSSILPSSVGFKSNKSDSHILIYNIVYYWIKRISNKVKY